MSTSVQLTQLQQDLQNELTSANQLLRLISVELQKIKSFTMSKGEFEENIKHNASLISELAKMQQININDLPPLKRIQPQLNMTQDTNQSYQQHDSFRNSMDDSQ